ncbi:MAG: NAD(P)H-hydrate dehydratase [Chloroflexota bacterium]
MKYVSVAEMIAVEKESHASGHTYDHMMEHAGRGLAEFIDQIYADLSKKRILGLVGSGNNGGDTLVALSYLADWGWQTTAYIVSPRPPDDSLTKRAVKAGSTLLDAKDDPQFKDLASSLSDHAVVMDGIFGTGIRLPLRGQAAEVLAWINRTLLEMDSLPHIVAVDCPSGVDCDNGEAAPECIPASFTVTMAAVKQGLLTFPAFNYVGDLHCVNIGLPDGLPAYTALQREVIDAQWVQRVLPDRPLDAHKGTFGTALVVAGSLNYTGAALLSGEAAYRSGAGLVTLGVPAPLHTALAGQLPEVTWLLLPHDLGVVSVDAVKVLREHLERVTALLIGPGFGVETTTGEFIARLLGAGQNKVQTDIGFLDSKKKSLPASAELPPLVIDADGLKLLANISDWPSQLPASTILTPHPGEMAVLTGLPAAEIQSHRLEIAEKFAAQWGHILVLKGAHTIIASPDGRTAIIPVASPALARAGTGDVLAGLIVGLRAQGLDAFEAAAAGAWIHAQAGLLAADVLGSTAAVLAGDLLSALVDVLADL